jgi:ABC-type ATPase involved in cell division
MSRYQKIQNALKAVSPLPVDLPKLYFLGDTGAGKTTIIRKFLGTEESKFPTTLRTATKNDGEII